METPWRKLTTSDKVLAFAAPASLVALAIGSWPEASGQLLLQLAAKASLGYARPFVVDLVYFHRGVGVMVYGYGLAAFCTLLALVSLFHGGLRQYVGAPSWLAAGVIGLILPVVEWIIFGTAWDERIPPLAWGFWLWSACYVAVIAVAVNRLAESRSTRENLAR